MSTAINQDLRLSNGQLFPDVTDITKQHVGNGAPQPYLGVIGNIYTDALTGTQYRKKNYDTWESTLNLPAVSSSILGAGNAGSGSGVGIFKELDPAKYLIFKSLEAGTNITIDEGPELLTINGAGGGLQSATNLGNGENVFIGESPAGNINFRTMTAGGSVSITPSASELLISSSGEANSGYNVGLPSASQLYKGMNGTLFQFKCVYSGNGELLNMADDVGNNNIIITPKLAVAHSNVIQNIGTIGDHYWGASNVSPSNTDAIVIKDSLTKLYRITAKILNDSLWSISSGVVNLQVGYYGSGSIVNTGNFITLSTIPLPVGTQNFDIVYNFPAFTNVPANAAVAVRVQNVSGVTSTNQADMSVSLVVVEY